TDKLATLTLTFPLFEGGLRMAELREARSKARQAGLERTLLEDRIEVSVKSALHDLAAVESVLENFKDQLASAQENFTLVEKQFAFGLATNIDVLDANSLLHDAQRQLSNATYNRDLAVLRLQKTVGLFLKGIDALEED
ncbi:MAG: TolC family protein, partial [Nitrospiria bacterium]